jgi:hypothetical protein
VQLLQYSYIRVLFVQRVRVELLVWGRAEMVVMCVVTAVLLHHSAMDRESESSVVTVG